MVGRGIDLHLVAGEWLGVIGPNGAGKSTLLRALAGVLRHTGTLEIGAGPRATQIALMPQTPLLPEGMSVVEYVLLGAPPTWAGCAARPVETAASLPR